MAESSASKPLLGKRYQVEETLGSGGMAVVYRARDIMLERLVAIKLLRQRYSRDPSFRQLFHQEAKSAGKLTHPNIVTIHDFGLEENRLFIVMEYVPGTDLKTIMAQKGTFTVREALHLIIQACFGIGYAHRAGLVHCDVKPQNMLVTPGGQLKVTDFGIARLLATIQPGEQHAIVWGSPLYFAPEQAAGDAPSPASDVYSIGVILYQMLTGRPPFVSDDSQELVRLHRDVAPIPPRQINPGIPVSLERIILKVLSKNPNARFSTADQLGRVLQAVGERLESASLETTAGSVPQKASVAPLNVQASVQGVISPAESKSPLHQPVSSPRIKEKPGPSITPRQENYFEFDWLTVGLGILATLFVTGLIPFWLYIYLSLSQGKP